MMARSQDRFANIAAVEVVESAQNTLTYAELLTGVSLGAGIGILVDQIDYYLPPGTMDLFDAVADTLEFGWAVSNTPTEINAKDRNFIHTAGVQIGLATQGGWLMQSPLSFQFFPPIIRASPRLYLAVKGLVLGAAATIQSRLYFRYIDLTTQEYLELAETGLVLG